MWLSVTCQQTSCAFNIPYDLDWKLLHLCKPCKVSMSWGLMAVTSLHGAAANCRVRQQLITTAESDKNQSQLQSLIKLPGGEVTHHSFASCVDRVKLCQSISNFLAPRTASEHPISLRQSTLEISRELTYGNLQLQLYGEFENF